MSGPRWSVAVYVGTSLAVTAVPVLAPILGERNIAATRVGIMSMACVGVSDAFAWAVFGVISLAAFASAVAGFHSVIGRLILGYAIPRSSHLK